MHTYKKTRFTILFSAVLAAAVIVSIFLAPAFIDEHKVTGIIGSNEPHVVTPPLPAVPEFCGEKVPMDDYEVYERMDREFIVNTYWHSATMIAIKKANRWFPVIEPILKKNNVPDDFKYISVIESGLANVTSPAQAVGFWQLTEAVALKYGLEVNKEVDERYNVEKSTETACAYIKEGYDKYKNWTMAAAAYNVGYNGLERQLLRQKENNYYNLVFNEETSRYIFRIIAMKEIMSNPNKYGFYLGKDDLYPPIETYKINVDTSIEHLADFAASHGVNYKILKYLNPWLRENYLPKSRNKTYVIKLPLNNSGRNE